MVGHARTHQSPGRAAREHCALRDTLPWCGESWAVLGGDERRLGRETARQGRRQLQSRLRRLRAWTSRVMPSFLATAVLCVALASPCAQGAWSSRSGRNARAHGWRNCVRVTARRPVVVLILNGSEGCRSCYASRAARPSSAAARSCPLACLRFQLGNVARPTACASSARVASSRESATGCRRVAPPWRCMVSPNFWLMERTWPIAPAAPTHARCV